ncbi:MAG: hypothetical protein ACE5JF_08670 [Anaerolineales bacterium]
METRTFETGPAPKIIFDNIGGSLRVRARETESVEVQAGANGHLKAEDKDGELTIGCDVDCVVFVPQDAIVDGKKVGGDASFRGFSGDVSVKQVGGSLSVRSVGATTSEMVGGDLTARQLSGSLSVDRVGGGAIVDQIQGDVRLRSLGGDVRLSRVEGLVEVTAGGDAKVSLSPEGDEKSAVTVGGDMNCYVADSASACVRLSAGGDLRLAVPVEATDIPGGCEIQLGEGQAEVDLTCGGDLVIRTGSDPEHVAAVDLGEAIAARVGAEIEAHMVDIEEGLTGLGDRLQGFDSDKVGSKIRVSIAKAQRKAARAQRKAARQRRTVAVMKDFSVGRPSRAGASEEERLMILRMLEEGKISVEEAETLLGALES